MVWFARTIHVEEKTASTPIKKKKKFPHIRKFRMEQLQLPYYDKKENQIFLIYKEI
jgi:hypothetical protein